MIGLGVQLVVFGGALLLLPVLFGQAAWAKVFAALSSLAWLLLLVGVGLAWLGYSRSRKAEAAAKDPSEPANANAQWPLGADVLAELATPAASPGAAPPRPTEWGRPVFASIEWRRFEAVVERLFQQAGFETRSQSHGADDGVDIWLYSRQQPGEPVSLVQCKHWQGKRVGVDKVRELRGVMAARQVRRGQFATTSSFTPEATAFARENGIHLLDVDGLLALIAKRSADEQAELLAVALEGDYWRPTCVNCGTKMVHRQPRKGGSPFWGCAGYPRCRTTMPMRAG